MDKMDENLKKQIIQEEKLKTIRTIMKSLNVSSDIAMEILAMSEKEKELYHALLLH